MLRMNRKGADLSITVIIVAAIALIVLVVLIAIFTGRIGVFSKAVDDQSKNRCQENYGGRCVTACDPTTEVRAFGAQCLGTDGKPIAGEICCIVK